MKKFLFVIVALVSACSAPPVVVPDLPLDPQKQTVNIPPALIKPCSPLTNLDDTKAYNQGDTTDVVSVWSDEHKDCSDRFHDYVVITSKALNINQAPASAPAAK
jgi:hypothetical protein